MTSAGVVDVVINGSFCDYQLDKGLFCDSLLLSLVSRGV